MPSRPAVRAEDKRLAEPGKKRKKINGRTAPPPRTQLERWAAGELKVSEMDDKELEKGKWRNSSGTFKGVGGPRTLPKKFADELMAERVRRWNKKVQEELDASLQALKDIRDNPRAPADARHKSAVYLIERAVGKVPEKNEVKVEMAPWELNIDGILVDDDNEQ